MLAFNQIDCDDYAVSRCCEGLTTAPPRSASQHASIDTRRSLARRIALNASLLVGAFILKVYGISVPVLRVAGGLIVAHAGWTLLNAGNQKSADEQPTEGRHGL
ncbi:MAG: MarC family protein [Candidatus Cybelea sp.]